MPKLNKVYACIQCDSSFTKNLSSSSYPYCPSCWCIILAEDNAEPYKLKKKVGKGRSIPVDEY